MPHQCTTCGRTFPDGSKEMLSGCPDCGGNKFQFKPSGASSDDQPTTTDQAPTSETASTRNETVSSDETTAPESPSSSPSTGDTESPGGSLGEGTAADTPDRTPDTTEPSPDPGATEPSPGATEASPDPDRSDEADPDTEQVRERTDEDTAQASARSDVVSPDELDQASRDPDSDAEVDPADADAPDAPHPDIGELRDELNEQFESIRIVSPGKYELNLMELYDRQEYIISLQEDGRYVIEMPDAWGISDE